MEKPSYGIPAGEIFLSISIGAFLAVVGLALTSLSLLFLVFVPFGFLLVFHGLTIFKDTTFRARIKLREDFMRILQPKDGDRILDVGTGRGLLAIGFAKAISHGEIVGIDVWSSFALTGNKPENAWKNAEIEGVKDKVKFETASATNIPYPDEYFNIVVASFVIHVIKGKQAREKALKEMVRVLKKGGKFAIAEPLSKWIFYSKKELEEKLSKLGLKNINFHKLRRPSYIVYGIKE